MICRMKCFQLRSLDLKKVQSKKKKLLISKILFFLFRDSLPLLHLDYQISHAIECDSYFGIASCTLSDHVFVSVCVKNCYVYAKEKQRLVISNAEQKSAKLRIIQQQKKINKKVVRRTNTLSMCVSVTFHKKL